MTPYYADESVTLYHGDALEVLRSLPDEHVGCCVTSPPYYAQRDYGDPGQYGLEPTPAEYVETMRAVFAEAKRVLAKDGTLWLNLGDGYSSTGEVGRNDAQDVVDGRAQALYPSMLQKERAERRVRVDYGVPPKNLLGIPWRVAFALQSDGWFLRNAIVWRKPRSVMDPTHDRLSKSYEWVFLLTRAPRYWFNLNALDPDHTVDVWEISPQQFAGAHFAVMPRELARRCIAAGCKPGSAVLDPFAGSATTGMVAGRLGHRFVGIDLSAKYLNMALRTRLAQAPLIGEVAS